MFTRRPVCSCVRSSDLVRPRYSSTLKRAGEWKAIRACVFNVRVRGDMKPLKEHFVCVIKKEIEQTDKKGGEE